MSYYRIRTVVLAGVVCAFVAWSFPVQSQQPQDDKDGALQQPATHAPAQADADTSSPPKAITAEDPTIPVDELKLLVQPLTVAELKAEAAAWLKLVKAKVQEISNTEIAIKRKNRHLAQEKEATKALEDAKATLAKAQAAQQATTPGSPEAEMAAEKVEAAKDALKKAQAAIAEAAETKKELGKDESLKEIVEEAEKDVEEGGKTAAEKEEEKKEKQENQKDTVTLSEPDPAVTEEPEQTGEKIAQDIDQAAAEIETGGADSQAQLKEKEQQLGKMVKKLEESTEAEQEVKTQLVVNVTTLQSERTGLVDRLKVILDEMEAKGGDPATYRSYIQAVSGVELDITDTQGLGVRLLSWLQSEEGGLRWAINIGKFFGIVLISIVVAHIIGAIVSGTMKKIGGTSLLLRKFVVMLIKRGGAVLGVVIGLTALEVSIGPLFAVIGGVGFVLAFALQSNLGNLASGLMLMLNKPFDVGDEVKIGDHWAYVESISLANTRLKAFNGSIVSLPNNTVWGSEITNYTHSDIRRLTFYIHIKFEQDMDQVYDMWMELASSHPKVLDDPAPGWAPGNPHYESYINVGLSAWSKTDEYWTVHVELLKMLQKRILESGIELTAPVQAIRLQSTSNPNGKMLNLPEKA
ncbi:mechanosensitive ion channel family protein [Candidatus Thiosymbion oneisti]|uniref:mechanosensitive ion channel family protein n=1 Tax=Candidatus Thiosymbion oneisti TaxID=589554 RepID=UPI000AA97E77|nr:mechanosensitive ion channel family protein [Candidatus Thiosymbion oneisti]